MLHRSKIGHMIQCKFLPSLKFCKGSALFLIPIELQFGRVINIDKSPMDTKDDLNPFILALYAIFQSFWPECNFVKEVPS